MQLEFSRMGMPVDMEASAPPPLFAVAARNGHPGRKWDLCAAGLR